MSKLQHIINGRINRKTYIYNVILSLFLYNFITLALMTKLSFLVENEFVLNINIIIFSIYIISQIIFSIKRLHDINKSGWYIVLCIIPIVNIWFIYLLLKKGDDENNKYGDKSITDFGEYKFMEKTKSLILFFIITIGFNIMIYFISRGAVLFEIYELPKLSININKTNNGFKLINIWRNGGNIYIKGKFTTISPTENELSQVKSMLYKGTCLKYKYYINDNTHFIYLLKDKNNNSALKITIDKNSCKNKGML